MLRSPPERTASHYQHHCGLACKGSAPEQPETRDGCLCPVTGENFELLARDAAAYLQDCMDDLGAAPCVLVRGQVAAENKLAGRGGRLYFPVTNKTLRTALGWLQDSIYGAPTQLPPPPRAPRAGPRGRSAGLLADPPPLPRFPSRPRAGLAHGLPAVRLPRGALLSRPTATLSPLPPPRSPPPSPSSLPFTSSDSGAGTTPAPPRRGE